MSDEPIEYIEKEFASTTYATPLSVMRDLEEWMNETRGAATEYFTPTRRRSGIREHERNQQQQQQQQHKYVDESMPINTRHRHDTDLSYEKRACFGYEVAGLEELYRDDMISQHSSYSDRYEAADTRGNHGNHRVDNGASRKPPRSNKMKRKVRKFSISTDQPIAARTHARTPTPSDTRVFGYMDEYIDDEYYQHLRSMT